MKTLFNGRYKIIDTIGSGGMGTVYLAESVSLGTKWAIKAISKKQSKNFDLLAEPNILKKLNHPALPRIIDIEQDDENLYIIEDYIEGMPLDKQLNLRKSFNEATVIEWSKQLCQVLIYLHKQQPNPIIYRDMKPSNIIVSSDNVVKVIDFGIAREFKTDSGSDTSYMGTRGYAAPEQYGTSQTDARTDIYSFGATLYHLLTGISPNEPPYQFLPLRQIDRSFSEGIEFIVAKCVQNNPKDRYQSVAELLHDLENIYTFNSYYKKQKSFNRFLLALKLFLIASFSFMFYSSFGVLEQESIARYDGYMETGYQALNTYRFDEASNGFTAAMAEDEELYEPYLGMAQILWKSGEFEECAAYLETLTARYPGVTQDANYNYIMGSAYFDNGQYAEALPFLLTASSADAQIPFLRDLGVCYAKLGDLGNAEQTLAQIIESGASDDNTQYVQGEILLARENHSEAVGSFRSVAENTADDVLKKKAYLALSDIYKGLRDTDATALNQQIAVLEEAARELNIENDVVLTEALAEAYYTAGEFDLSMQAFQKLLDIGYERPYIYRNLAIIEQQRQNFDNAGNYLAQMCEKYPDDYQCYLQLAYLCVETEGLKPQDERDYSAVLEYYEMACRYAPEGENTVDVQPIASLITELTEKGWLQQ